MIKPELSLQNPNGQGGDATKKRVAMIDETEARCNL
jgi:hypothetical protein